MFTVVGPGMLHLVIVLSNVLFLEEVNGPGEESDF